MMKQLLMTGFLAVGLLACAPSQTTSTAPRGHEILKPGQVWEINAVTVTGQIERFTLTTAALPVRDRNGMLGYEDILGQHIVEDVNSLADIYYDPVDADPEFIVARWLRTNAITYKEHYCISWLSPDQKTLDFFEGRYAGSNSILLEYAAKNDTSIVGKCTITLKK